jgi:hypothetical protein
MRNYRPRRIADARPLTSAPAVPPVALALVPRPLEGFMWRVSWGRADRRRRRRTFVRWQDTARFLRRLLGDARPDLSPLVSLRVERRSVGPWEPMPTWRELLQEGGRA